MRLLTVLAALVPVPAALVALPVLSVAPTPRPVPPRVESFALAEGTAGVQVAQAATPPAAGTAAAGTAARSTSGRTAPGVAARRATTGRQVLVDRRSSRPFDLVALTWSGPAQVPGLAVTARVLENGSWSPWTALEAEDDADGEGVAGRSGTAPLLTDGATAVQVRVSTGGPLPAGLEAHLVDGGDSPSDGVTPGPVAAAQAAVAAPTVVTRAQWGADESLRSGGSVVNSRVRALVLHHTAGSNSYSSAGAYAELRATYAYHTQVRGWSDIGYNLLVDRYGRIYEGRKGSITQAVRAAHAGGFNTDTFGVSVMGNFDTASPPAAVVSAVTRVMAWKASQYGIDPAGSTTLTSEGGGTARWPAGTRVTRPTIMGHRDVGLTACPGQYLYPKLTQMRADVATLLRTPTTPPPTTPPPPPPAGLGPQAISGDWDGDGKDEPGLWDDGKAAVRLHDGRVVRFAYGFAGARAFAGDFDGDGRDTIGIFAGGTFYLRDSLTSGVADTVVHLGRTGDLPVLGRWPWMSGGQGIGVVRAGQWYLRRSFSDGPAEISFAWARASDVPLAADVDGDRLTEPVVFRDGTFYLGDAVPVGSARPVAFGKADDQPVLGDWDGDGRATPGVFRESVGAWYWRDDLSGGMGTSAVAFAG